MTLRQTAAVALVSSSTLICTVVVGLFLGAELMTFLSTETVSPIVVMRWLRWGLGGLFVAVAVAVVGVLIGCPPQNDPNADKGNGGEHADGRVTK